MFVQNMGLTLHFQFSRDAQCFFVTFFDCVQTILKYCSKFVCFVKNYKSNDNNVSSRDYIVKIYTLERFSKTRKIKRKIYRIA